MAVNLGTIFSTLDADLRPLLRGIDRAKKELSDYKKTTTTATLGPRTRGGQAGVANIPQIKSTQDLLTSLSSKFSQLRNQGVGTFSAIFQSVSSLPPLFGALTAAAGAFVVVLAGRAIADFVSSSLLAAESIRSLKISMEAAAGSVQGGAQAFQFARDLANQLGLSLRETADNYKGILAATVASGGSAEAAQFIFEGMGTAIRAMGLNSEAANRVLRATGQIMSKGKVQAEELRGQLGEHLPNAIGALASSLGVTTGELNKMMERGELTSSVLINLAGEFQKTLGSAVQKQAQSLTAELARLRNSAFELMVSFGEGGLTRVAIGVVKALQSLLVLAQELVPVFKLILAPVMALIEGFSFLVRTTVGVVTAINDMVNSLGSIINNLGPVAAAIDLVTTAIEKLGEIGSKIFGFVKTQVVNLASALGSVIPDSVKQVASAGLQGFRRGFTGGRAAAAEPKTAAQIDAQVAALKRTLPSSVLGNTQKAQQEAFRTEKAELQAITSERSQQRSILQQQIQLSRIQSELSASESNVIGQSLGQLQAQMHAKQRLLEFDRETIALEIQKLQSIKGVSAADQAKIASQIAAKNFKLDELNLTEQIIQSEFKLASQKERQVQSQRTLETSAQSTLNATRVASQLAIENLKQQGASRKEITAIGIQGEKEILALKAQQLSQELAIAQAKGLNTEGIQREIALLKQSQELLAAQQTTVRLEPLLNQAREFSDILTDSLESFIGNLTTGTLNLGETLTNLGQNLIDSSLTPLFNQIQQSLQQVFTNIGRSLGGLGGLLFGGVLVGIGTLFNRQKSETRALADQVRGNIEQIETVRGLIAGDQNIAVQQLGQNLAEAFRPTNDILRSIDGRLATLLAELDIATTSSRTIGQIEFSVLGAPRL